MFLFQQCTHVKQLLKIVKYGQECHSVQLHNFWKSRLHAIISRVRNEPAVLVELSEEQLVRLKDIEKKDKGTLLFNQVDNVKKSENVPTGTGMMTPADPKKRKWYDPLPEYHFNWYKMRYEEMSAKQKDQQWLIDITMVIIVCGSVVAFIKLLKSTGMDGRDKFFEISTWEKFDELGKTNMRKKHKPPETMD